MNWPFLIAGVFALIGCALVAHALMQRQAVLGVVAGVLTIASVALMQITSQLAPPP